MRHRRARRPLRALALVLGLATSATPFAACRTSSEAVGKGGECLLATDCAPGLVCIAQRNGARVCTDDLSGVGGRPIPDGAPPPEGGDGTVDPDAPVDPDTGTPDVTPPPPDTGPPDTGPVDTGVEGG
ncbi:MAG: hypothetical protein KC657_26665 [Myxococcales bacterium]|nr:hypothetical protein [Myxococcales bacterium]